MYVDFTSRLPSVQAELADGCKDCTHRMDLAKKWGIRKGTLNNILYQLPKVAEQVDAQVDV